MGDYFAVGLRGELDAVFYQILFDFHVVFDDAIVDDGDLLIG